jgi:hypothetical protein
VSTLGRTAPSGHAAAMAAAGWGWGWRWAWARMEWDSATAAHHSPSAALPLAAA